MVELFLECSIKVFKLFWGSIRDWHTSEKKSILFWGNSEQSKTKLNLTVILNHFLIPVIGYNLRKS